ncbi:GPW/gp25 family protein [Parapedobacter sp. DT-150]|uniref:GPW/gp25 family protein n=1 Tax=Parapedobacter sp. DT-150 TaxID=3396162 RepID=UPI003F1B62FA
MDSIYQSFLGKGWSFPPEFDQASARTEMVGDIADINGSLALLLATRPGERVMNPTYGCNLDELVFESLTTTLKTHIIDLIQTAILYHEPRITANKIDIEEQLGTSEVLIVRIDYTVRSTNSRFNFVYPFYINEATELSMH